MKYVVFGVGVQGSVYAAKLAAAGCDVSLVARGRRAAELRANGIVIEHAFSKERDAVRLPVIERLDERVARVRAWGNRSPFIVPSHDALRIDEMREHDVTPPNGSQPVTEGPAEDHQREIQSLEEAVYHETTQHAPKHHPQKVQAVPPTARSQQRRFPR